MVKKFGLVALAVLCGAPALHAQSAARPTQARPAEDHEIKPPPLEDPAAVPGWAAHAVDDILSGRVGPADTNDERKR